MTYVLNTAPDARGHARPRSWHIAKLHTRAINGWKTYCGRYIETTDTMAETPNAATCEVCFRYEAKAAEAILEATAAPDPVDTDVPAE